MIPFSLNLIIETLLLISPGFSHVSFQPLVLGLAPPSLYSGLVSRGFCHRLGDCLQSALVGIPVESIDGSLDVGLLFRWQRDDSRLALVVYFVRSVVVRMDCVGNMVYYMHWRSSRYRMLVVFMRRRVMGVRSEVPCGCMRMCRCCFLCLDPG